MTSEEITNRALAAERIVNDDLFNEVWDKLITSYTSKWVDTADDDTKTREVVYNRLKALQEVKREFVRILNAKRILDKG